MDLSEAYRPPAGQTVRVKRSSGVGPAAVVAIIGSVLVALFGGLMLLGLVVAANDASALPPDDPAATPVVVALVAAAVGLAGWGIASAIGLLRLKEWARISFIVFSVLLLGWSGLMALSALFVVAAPIPLPPDAPPWLATVIAVPLFLFAGAGAGCAVWWLIVLNRAAVKAQFAQQEPDAALYGGPPVRVAASPRIPVRILVAALLMVLSAVQVPLQLVNSSPAVFFGAVVVGPMAAVLTGLQVGIAAIAGIGLLRKYARAHSLAVAVSVFGLVNGVVSMLVPGALSRVSQLLAESAGQPPLSTDGWMMPMYGISLVFAGGLLWALVSGRRRYLLACEAAPLRPVEAPTP